MGFASPARRREASDGLGQQGVIQLVLTAEKSNIRMVIVHNTTLLQGGST